MQVWKRRLIALVAVGAGSVSFFTSSSVGAQTTPPTIPGSGGNTPDFSIPEFPDFPEFPEFPEFPTPSVTFPPPPTMPPTSFPTTTSPPPTMPPTSFPTSIPPPTMPPTSLPTTPTVPNDIDQVIEEFFDEIDALFEAGEPTFEAMQEIIDQLRADLFG